MAGEIVGGKAKRLEYAPGQKVAEIHPPLRVPDAGAQAVVGPPGDLGERLTASSASVRVEPPQRVGCGRHLSHEALKHVGVLRALAGEDRCYERPTARRGHRRRGDRPRPCHAFFSLDSRLSDGGNRTTVVDNHVADLVVLDDGHASCPESTRIERGKGQC